MHRLRKPVDKSEEEIHIDSVAREQHGTRRQEPLLCQMCNMNLDALSPDERQAHYDKHLDAPSSSRQHAAASSTSVSSATKRKWYQSPKREDFFWYPRQEGVPPSNFTPGLILLLKKALTSSHEKGQTQRAFLCYERTVHVYHEIWDAKWGCGYRNFLMACTALMDQQFQPEYAHLLDEPLPPSVRNLQVMIEDAWANGFDKEGAQQLKHELVGRKKWIGTAELYVALAHRGIPSQLADFHLKGEDATPLIKWVKQYFSPQQHKGTTVQNVLQQAVVVTNFMPLILQHQGHSRTVVGYEVTKTGSTNLLIFDPAKRVESQMRDAALHKFYTATGSSSTQGPYTHGHDGQGHRERIMNRLKRPFKHHDDGGDSSRMTSPSPSGRSPVKRIRAGEAPDDDVIVIEDDHEDEVQIVGESAAARERGPSGYQGKGKVLGGNEAKVDYGKLLKFVRVDEKTLATKNKYQILWFPLDAPLSEHAKRRRYVVTSEKVC